jgi:hypothetical protein
MENQQNTIYLNIAGFSIMLYSNFNFELEEGYEPFISDKKTNEADITIRCFDDMPIWPFSQEELVFEAENEDQKFYSIFQARNDLGFLIYDQQNPGKVQQMAVLDKSFTKWMVFSKPNSENRLFPLKYPLGPIIMHYLTINSDAVMMHASCAYDGTQARLFTGFSGNGKSTISKLWSDAGNQIINDDRIIIRKEKDGYFVYNTPMYYKDISKRAPLGAIYLIRHSPGNILNKLSGALAISKVMAFCIQNNFDKQFIQSRLNFFSDLCMHIPVCELGFVPDESVVDYVLAHEKGGDK